MENCAFVLGKTFADGGVGHRGNPQPLHRFFAARHAVNVAKNQFALARRIRCADDFGGVFVVHQLFDNGELGTGGRQHLQGDVCGQNGQIGHAPAPVALVQLVRLHERNEVAQRPGDNVIVSRKTAIPRSGSPQHPGNIAPYGRLFCDDYGIHKPKHITKSASVQAKPCAGEHPDGFERKGRAIKSENLGRFHMIFAILTQPCGQPLCAQFRRGFGKASRSWPFLSLCIDGITLNIEIARETYAGFSRRPAGLRIRDDYCLRRTPQGFSRQTGRQTPPESARGWEALCAFIVPDGRLKTLQVFKPAGFDDSENRQNRLLYVGMGRFLRREIPFP